MAQGREAPYPVSAAKPGFVGTPGPLERTLLLAPALLLPVLFFPAGQDPFSPAKRDAFAILVIAQVGSLLADGWDAARAVVARVAGLPAILPLLVLLVVWTIAQWCVGTGGPSRSVDTLIAPASFMVLLGRLDRRLAGEWFAVYAAGLGAGCAYALLQVHALDPFAWQAAFAGNAPGGTFGNPLFLGSGLVVGVAWSFGGMMMADRRAAWIVPGSCCGLFLGVFGLTGARGAWLGAAVAVAYVLNDADGLRRLRDRGARLVLPVALASGFLGSAPTADFGGGMADVVHTVAVHAAGVLAPGQWLGRQLMWESTLRMWRDRPLFGWGAGGVADHYLEYQGALLAQPRYASLPYHSTSHSHQDFLQFAAEHGALGIGVLFWIVVVAVSGRPACGQGFLDQRIAIGALLGLGVDGLVNGPLHVAPTSLLGWSLLAVAGTGMAGKSPAVRSERRRPTRPVGLIAIMILTAGAASPYARDFVGEAWLREGVLAIDRLDAIPGLHAVVRADALLAEDRRQRFHAGRAWFLLKRDAEAIREFTADVEANPGVHSGWHNLGMALWRSGRRGEAAACFARAAALNPRDPDSRNWAGRTRRTGHGIVRKTTLPGRVESAEK